MKAHVRLIDFRAVSCPGLDDEDSRQGLVHITLLEAFLYMNIKMRFPEGMSTLLIGLFTISEFKVSWSFVVFYIANLTERYNLKALFVILFGSAGYVKTSSGDLYIAKVLKLGLKLPGSLCR